MIRPVCDGTGQRQLAAARTKSHASERPLQMIVAKFRPTQVAVEQRETDGQLRPDVLGLPLGRKGHTPAPTASPSQAHA